MSNETIPAAETVLPKNLCPLIKSSYGFAITDTCPYTYWADLIVGETTCDGKKKMYDLLGQRKPMYILQLPQGIDRPAAMWIRGEGIWRRPWRTPIWTSAVFHDLSSPSIHFWA